MVESGARRLSGAARCSMFAWPCFLLPPDGGLLETILGWFMGKCHEELLRTEVWEPLPPLGGRGPLGG